MLGHNISKAPTELSINKRSSYMKDVTTQNNWTFELSVGESNNSSISVIVGFMQR